MQLFLVPCSFFVCCCSRRCLLRSKHSSKGAQVPAHLNSSVLLAHVASLRSRVNNLPASCGDLGRKPLLPASFLVLLCGLMAPLALQQICNMLNAPADEYFTFQVTALCQASPVSAGRGAALILSIPRACLMLGGDQEAHTVLMSHSPWLGRWPPSSTFFRERRRGGRRRRGRREGCLSPQHSAGGLPLLRSLPPSA